MKDEFHVRRLLKKLRSESLLFNDLNRLNFLNGLNCASRLGNHMRDLDPVLFIPFSSNKRTASHLYGFI